MILIQMFLSTLFSTNLSLATKYVPLSIDDKVSRSSIIVTGKIVSLNCIDEQGSKVSPGEKCTAPGLNNKKWYKFQVEKILKDSSGALNEKGSNPVIDFKFTSMAHTSVPEDNYGSVAGSYNIVYLNYRNNEFSPVHEAFYFDSPDTLKEVLKSILKGQKAAEVVDAFASVQAKEVANICFQLNSGTIEALKFYKECSVDSSENSKGHCSRSDGSTIHFFKSLSDCKASQSKSTE